MCTGLEIAALVGAGASTAGALKRPPSVATQPAQQAPKQPVAAPPVGQRRPRGAYGAAQLLSQPLTGGTQLLGR